VPWKEVNADGTRATNQFQSLEKNEKKLGKNQMKTSQQTVNVLLVLGASDQPDNDKRVPSHL